MKICLIDGDLTRPFNFDQICVLRALPEKFNGEATGRYSLSVTFPGLGAELYTFSDQGKMMAVINNMTDVLNTPASYTTYPINLVSSFGVPTVDTVSSASQLEGTPLVHTVTLSGAYDYSMTVAYSFDHVTTVAGDIDTVVFSDDVVNNGDGTITIPDGVSSFTITVTPVDDLDIEGDETYTVSVAGVSGTGTIQNNDT